MTVAELLRRCSSAELAEWRAELQIREREREHDKALGR